MEPKKHRKKNLKKLPPRKKPQKKITLRKEHEKRA